jgi:MGT family glycosyltransferase
LQPPWLAANAVPASLDQLAEIRRAHFGVLSYKGTGHLNPLIALSRQLTGRGHRVTFFQKPEVESEVRRYGLEFVPIGAPRPLSVEESGGRLTPLSGIALLRNGIRRIVGDMEMFLREVPAALIRAGVDILIVDEIALSGPTLAEMLRLPYFVVSTSVPHTFGWTVPRRIASPATCFDRVQDALLDISVFRMRGPVRRRLDRYRRQAGLGPLRRIKTAFPELAHITQLPRCLDLPRSALPRNFYYTGPFVDEVARPPVEFPWDQLDGRPLVYATLGTTRKGERGIFPLIAEACGGLNLQLVISLGGRKDPEVFAGLPGNPLVVRTAPQLDLLKRAEVAITHGGLNTALETLMEGKPMIVIPKSLDQPAVATRLERLRVAEAISIRGLTAKKIRVALVKVLGDSSYRDAARRMQAEIRSSRGLERAADVIEQLMEKKQHAIHG